ncbi:MAG: SDR family oxidoreductase [Desulfobacterales bacterium]|nr:SDR family oxidoreductase [Desulfobacterales bacterium]
MPSTGGRSPDPRHVARGDGGQTAAEAELKALGGEVATVVCNVTREEDCARLADTAIEKFGQINLVAPFAGIIKRGGRGRETGQEPQDGAWPT